MQHAIAKSDFGTRLATARFTGSVGLVILMASGACAEVQGCALVDGALPANCYQANEGQVVARELGANTANDAQSDLGDLGFSISIDHVEAGGPRRSLAGAVSAQNDTQDVDRIFESLGIQLTYDGLGAKQKLNVSTSDLRRSYVAGDVVSFRASTNYPAWINRAELRINGRDGTVIVLPIEANGIADWVMPEVGEAEMSYTLRVYDAQGRFDETAALPISRTAARLADAALEGKIVAAGEGEDRTARRSIPVRGGAVTVAGLAVPPGTAINVMGEPVILDQQGGFFVQRILPPGDHGVQIGVGGQAHTRDVSIPTREVFATGIIDLTLGRNSSKDEFRTRGRIAGFAQGVTANGTRFTASVDTAEDDLRDLFSNFGRKDPNNVLRGIDPDDVWVTTGDDSTAEDLAPSSGKLYLKVERNGSHLVWGDFMPTEDLDTVIRSDRRLYGVEGIYRSIETIPNGESRFRFSGYASQPDTLMQRDIFRGTGGTTYFLSRRDIERGTESLVIETRDLTSGRLISARRLIEGQDYRINPVQGVVNLNAPLSPSVGSGGLVMDRPLGDYDVNLVAQYEYVPTTGDVDGITAGGRAETWVTDQLRLGVSAAQEGSGLADNTLVGVDLLFQYNDESWLRFDMAESEGPGFGSSFSLNGGLEIDPETPSAGLAGQAALGYRVEGRLDLAEIGRKGFIVGYYDDRQAGFTSPDHDIEVAQKTFGIDGEVAVGPHTRLTFGADQFEDAEGKTRKDVRIGAGIDLGTTMVLEVTVNHTDRITPGNPLADDNGKRTDIGAKLTWDGGKDLSYWVFGQTTLEHIGSLDMNDRLGIGAKARISDAFSILGEASVGTIGGAGRAELAWKPNASSTYSLGYRLDPTREIDSDSVTGADRGTVVLGAQSKLNDWFTYTTEYSYSAFGSEPALQTTHGVTYTPSDRWRYDFGLFGGETTESEGTTIQQRGFSFGVSYSGGEGYRAGLKGEYRTEDSDNPARVQDRETVLLSGAFERQTSPDWRLISAFDVVLSEADQDNLRDGRYVEGKLGYAYRPVDNDRLNALLSYTFLYDLPGPDQVNLDGDADGPKQRSHIINLAANYDLNQQFTLGGKYGFRYREEADRGSDDFTSTVAHLGVLRLDYHIFHNWDIMGEIRAMVFPNEDTTDYGSLLAVYRDFGDNARIGAGYSWGAVTDDLRSFEAKQSGLFLNIIGKF